MLDIKHVLPNVSEKKIDDHKGNTPYGILIELSKAVNEKYNKKLFANVVESYKLKKDGKGGDRENLVFAFYFIAPIAKGYLYRLLEIEQIAGSEFPVKLTVYENNPVSKGIFKQFDGFLEALSGFMQSSFVETLIINLMTQVELYEESRTLKYPFE